MLELPCAAISAAELLSLHIFYCPNLHKDAGAVDDTKLVVSQNSNLAQKGKKISSTDASKVGTGRQGTVPK
jgi:hypothetical protein